MPKVAIILSEGFADWEYGFIAGTGGPFYGLDVGFFAPRPGALRSQGGLTATVERAAEAVAGWAPDAVAVVGGTAWAGEDPPDVGAALRAARAGGARVAGICGGTLALARAGLLDEAAHTSNDRAFLARHAPGYRGAARYRDSAAAVVDDGVVTAPGTAPASFAAAVFESVGVPPEAVRQFRAMLAAEHTAAWSRAARGGAGKAQPAG